MELVDAYVAVGVVCVEEHVQDGRLRVERNVGSALCSLDLLKRYREGRTLHPWDLGYVS
jgi:hypothetical protein